MLFTKDCVLFICFFSPNIMFHLYWKYIILYLYYTESYLYIYFWWRLFFANKKTYNTATEQKSELHKVGLGISLNIVLTVLVK